MSAPERLHVLYISDLFPTPARPALGIFVERQATHLLPYCDITVVAPTRIFPPLRLWKQILSPRRFWHVLQKWRKDVLQTPRTATINQLPVTYPRYTSLPKHLFYSTWGFVAYPFLWRHLRRLHRQHNFDLIHAHYASPCGVIALLAQRWMRVPVVVSVHGMDVTYTVKQHRLAAMVVRWVFRRVDAVLANSNWTYNQIIRVGGMPAKTTVVRLGGDTSPSFRPSAVHAHRSATLLSVGYLENRKGHAYVVRALYKLIQAGYHLQYVIVGSGGEEERLRTLVHELDLESYVHFAGYKAHNDIWPYFEACDIFVLPSWNEAFGVVYIEALGMGKPVVACAGEGGPEDLAALGDCVELVKPRDVDSLATALQLLLDSPQRRHQMGETGRAIVEQFFTWHRNALDTFNIYRQVLGMSQHIPSEVVRREFIDENDD